MSEECEHNWIAGNDPTYCNKCGETNTAVFIATIQQQQSELSALRQRVRELESVLESVCWVEDEEEDVGMSYTQCRFCSGFSKHNSGCILSTGSAEG